MKETPVPVGRHSGLSRDGCLAMLGSMCKAAQSYYDRVIKLLQDLQETQLEAICEAAELCAGRIARGGLVFLFGTGHSSLMCEEMTPRQGGFVGFVCLKELAVTHHADIIGSNGLRAPLFLEKVPGYAEELLKGWKFGENDVFILISTSGIRPLVVEMAMGVKARGLPLIGITALKHSRSVPAAHASGKKLMDIADIIIDNQCPKGDCVVELEGLDWATGPASTVTGAMVINQLRCEVAQRLLDRGIQPEMLPSHQLVDNADAETQLERFYEGYRKSLAHLFG